MQRCTWTHGTKLAKTRSDIVVIKCFFQEGLVIERWNKLDQQVVDASCNNSFKNHSHRMQ